MVKMRFSNPKALALFHTNYWYLTAGVKKYFKQLISSRVGMGGTFKGAPCKTDVFTWQINAVKSNAAIWKF